MPASGALSPTRHALRAAAHLSELDRSIIALLQDDGRRSFSSLARELSATEKTVRKRVNELRESGVIQITVVTNPALLGFSTIALLGLTVDRVRPVTDIALDLVDVDDVSYVSVTAGRYDAMVEIMAQDLAALERVLDSRIATVNGVRHIEAFPYLRMPYSEPDFAVARQKGASPGGRPRRRAAALEETDRAIIRELSRDGRVSFRNISASVGVSETQVARRVHSLTEAGAVRVLALTSPASLGYRALAWVGIQGGPGARIKDLADHLAALETVSYVAICVGRFDIWAEVVCVDEDDLLRVLDDEIRQLPGVGRVELAPYAELYYKFKTPRTAHW
jgi:Lrp/AsnC family transcriptional regulator for asnA, asnC and gidA